LGDDICKGIPKVLISNESRILQFELLQIVDFCPTFIAAAELMKPEK